MGRPRYHPMFNAVATVRNEDIHKQVIATRELGPGVSLIAVLTTTLDALLVDQHTKTTEEGTLPDRTCWGYGKTRHWRRDCPHTKPHTRCPPTKKNPSTCHLYGMQDLIYIPIDTILVYYMDDLLLVCSDKRYL